MTCKKTDCPIYEFCDKEKEQAYYCRKVELLVHLSRSAQIKPQTRLVQPLLPVYDMEPLLH